MELCIELVGEQARCKLDGKETLSAALADFLAMIVEHGDSLSLPDAIPEGVRFIRRRGEVVVLVIEEKPQVRTVRWLTDDSPVSYGSGAVYRIARLAFPFMVLIIAFRGGELTGYQQCFYRSVPLRRLDDQLFLPNLYNVARGYGQPCWICLANLTKSLSTLPWEDKVREIRAHLWGAGFNRSSEEHEGMSYWQAMRQVDPRLKNLAVWEEASKKDPFFPLTVKWQSAGTTVGEVVEEALSATAPASLSTSAEGLSRLLTLCRQNGSHKKWQLSLRRRNA
jgi:hypothetical protein